MPQRPDNDGPCHGSATPAVDVIDVVGVGDRLQVVTVHGLDNGLLEIHGRGFVVLAGISSMSVFENYPNSCNRSCH